MSCGKESETDGKSRVTFRLFSSVWMTSTKFWVSNEILKILPYLYHGIYTYIHVYITYLFVPIFYIFTCVFNHS